MYRLRFNTEECLCTVFMLVASMPVVLALMMLVMAMFFASLLALLAMLVRLVHLGLA